MYIPTNIHQNEMIRNDKQAHIIVSKHYTEKIRENPFHISSLARKQKIIAYYITVIVVVDGKLWEKQVFASLISP